MIFWRLKLSHKHCSLNFLMKSANQSSSLVLCIFWTKVDTSFTEFTICISFSTKHAEVGKWTADFTPGCYSAEVGTSVVGFTWVLYGQHKTKVGKPSADYEQCSHSSKIGIRFTDFKTQFLQTLIFCWIRQQDWSRQCQCRLPDTLCTVTLNGIRKFLKQNF